jgi:hypothetical protein
LQNFDHTDGQIVTMIRRFLALPLFFRSAKYEHFAARVTEACEVHGFHVPAHSERNKSEPPLHMQKQMTIYMQAKREARERGTTHTALNDVLEKWWRTVRKRDMDEARNRCIVARDYYEMVRAIFEVLLPNEQLNVTQLAADFDVDAEGHEMMSRRQLLEMLSEMAELWIESAEPNAYGNFLSEVLAKGTLMASYEYRIKQICSLLGGAGIRPSRHREYARHLERFYDVDETNFQLLTDEELRMAIHDSHDRFLLRQYLEYNVPRRRIVSSNSVLAMRHTGM